MKVARLIEKLGNFPTDVEVYVDAHLGIVPVDSVQPYTADNEEPAVLLTIFEE